MWLARELMIIAILYTIIKADSGWKPMLVKSYRRLAYPAAASQFSKYDDTTSLEESYPVKVNRVTKSSIFSGSSIPIVEPDPHCSIYKVSMNQEIPNQYVEYEGRIPNLSEFTVCYWIKFHDHSTDHPLFSYSVGHNPKEILSWVSNTKEASFFSIAIAGHTFYRLNYPLKLKQWYHTCQSWNGKTGEWQIWVNAERIGRGFNNRLVGHVIKGGGTAVTGQDQSQLFNKPIIGDTSNRGLIGEVTMLQLYRVALTAGKAHRDHKHHHVHQFKHNGAPIEPPTTPAPMIPTTQPTPLGNGQVLIGGQIQRGTRLNLAGMRDAQMVPVQLPNGVKIQQPYINGQLGSRIVAEQLIRSANTKIPTDTSFGQVGGLFFTNDGQYLDDLDDESHSVFGIDSGTRRSKRDNPEIETEKILQKRGLVALANGDIIDDTLLVKANLKIEGTELDDDDFRQSLLKGLAGFDGNQPIQDIQKEKVDEREPAEAEVMAVMNICTGCTPEPFKKALILSWRSVPKKLHAGAHFYKGHAVCKAF